MMKSNANGKGSVPRPVDKKVFDKNWDLIFKKVRRTGTKAKRKK